MDKQNRMMQQALQIGVVMIAIVITASSWVSAEVPTDSAYQALFNNQFDEALEQFESSQDHQRLMGQGWVWFAQGESEKAAKAWLELLPEMLQDENPVPAEGLLYFLDQLENRSNLSALLLERYRAIAESGKQFSPQGERALWRRIQNLSLDSGQWALADQAANQLGLLRHWQWVAGPFSRSGAEDLLEVLGPERNLEASSWVQGGRTVKKVSSETYTRPDGFDFSDFLYPAQGVLYAFSRFEIDEEGPAELWLNCTDSALIWVNGERVLTKMVAERDTVNPLLIPCQFKKGSNWILIKLLKDTPGAQFKLSLLRQGRALAYRFVEGTPEDAHVDLLPERQKVSPAVEPISITKITQIFPALLTWAVAADQGLWPQAEDQLKMIVEEAPQFALAYRLMGETYLLETTTQPGSRNRLEKQAQEAFEKALELAPIDSVAAQKAASYYLSRQQSDAAREVLEKCFEARQKAGLDITSNLWLQRGRVYRQKEFWAEARDDIQKAYEVCPQKPRTVRPLVDLLNDSEGQQEAFALLDGLFAHQSPVPLLDAYFNQAQRVGQETRALSILNPVLEQIPSSRNLRLKQAELLTRIGNLQAAKDDYLQLTQQCPDDPESFIQLAEMSLGQIKPGMDKEKIRQIRNRAKEYLLSAIAVFPQSFRAQELLRQIRQVGQIQSVDDWYSEFDMTLEDIDREALARLPQERAGAVYLIDSSVMEIFPNGTARNMIHIAVQLKNKEGRERFAEINIPKRPGVHLLWARTISPDGKKIFEPSSIHDLGRATGISMISLEDGCIVDYAYEEYLSWQQEAAQGFQDQTFLFGGHEDPMLVSRFIIKVADGVAFHYATHPTEFAPEVEQRENCRIYRWQQQDIEGVKKEQFQPALNEIVHSVHISTTPDFVMAQRMTREIGRGRLEKPEVISSVAKEISTNLQTQNEKIDAVYHYVQQKIEESGLGGKTVYDTLYTGSGKTLDRIFLARALLDSMGIPSYLALGGNSQQFRGLPPIPVRQYFSYPILFVPNNDPSGCGFSGHQDDRWLDFSSRYHAPDLDNAQISQEMIWVCREGREYLTRVNLNEEPGGWLSNEVDFNLNPDGSASMKGLMTFFGGIPTVYRQQMTNPDLRQRIIDYSIGRTFRGIQIDRTNVFGETDLENHLAFGFEGSMPRLLQAVGEQWQLAPVLEPANMSDLSADATRETPLDFSSWVKLTPYAISVSLPEDAGWTFWEVPEDTLLISDFGVYSLMFSIEGTQLHVTRSLLVPPQRIDPEDYPRFAEFCRGIDAAEQRNVVIGVR